MFSYRGQSRKSERHSAPPSEGGGTNSPFLNVQSAAYYNKNRSPSRERRSNAASGTGDPGAESSPNPRSSSPSAASRQVSNARQKTETNRAAATRRGTLPGATSVGGSLYTFDNLLIESKSAQLTSRGILRSPPGSSDFAGPFAVSTSNAPVYRRTLEERAKNPDRLYLDRKNLSVCPILEREENLSLLNLQHNKIGRIENLDSLRRLVFLDLYNNAIEDISGLENLISLKVLMLGKNRVTKIHNLDHLEQLDILDLHGNEISAIENLNHLSSLRVLNLAGNRISFVDNLKGLNSLLELNLRRNRIRVVYDVENLPSLQRLFLSYNEISRFEDLACLSMSMSLTELCLDGNPFASDPNYRILLLSHVVGLRQLDMKRVVEEERRTAQSAFKKEEEKKMEYHRIAQLQERKRTAITNARKQWENTQGVKGTTLQPQSVAKYIETLSSNPSPVLTDDNQSGPQSEEEGRAISARSDSRLAYHDQFQNETSRNFNEHGPADAVPQQRPPKADVKPQNHDDSRKTIVPSDSSALAEVTGSVLKLYGAGSLDSLDRSWAVQATATVTSVLFQFIDFSEIAKVLWKLRSKFPNVQELVFSECNIGNLQQLNALAGIRRLDELTISPEGNPICQFSLWKYYVIFRLAGFQLKKINGQEISHADIVNAEKTFGSLAQNTSNLPQYRLQLMLGDSKKRPGLNGTVKKKGETKDTRLPTELVGRAGLQFLSPEMAAEYKQDEDERRTFAQNVIKDLSTEVIYNERKRDALARQWPRIFRDVVQSTARDLVLHRDRIAKQRLKQLEQSLAS